MTNQIEQIEARIALARAELSLTEALQKATPQQAVNYIENNVTSLQTAKVVLKLMARLIIILRDQIPNIQD
jgi:hypothetical protein